jgi:hypothetical protein
MSDIRQTNLHASSRLISAQIRPEKARHDQSDSSDRPKSLCPTHDRLKNRNFPSVNFGPSQSRNEALGELFDVSIGITLFRPDQTRLRRDHPHFVRSRPGYAGFMEFILHLYLPSLLTNNDHSRAEGHQWRADRNPRGSRCHKTRQSVCPLRSYDATVAVGTAFGGLTV